MRLGKRQGPARDWKKAGYKVKPKHVSPESIPGQVSVDWITTVFIPKFRELTTEDLQNYAAALLEYEDALKESENSTTEATKDDTETRQRSFEEEIVMPIAPLFDSQYRIDEFLALAAEVSDHFFAKTGGWRIHANAAKFERMLDEKYGVFRPFITEHPEIEAFIRSMQRKYALGEFSPIRRGRPPIPRSTAVIILFMMQRGGINWQILLLAVLFFLIGLQPWALVGVMIVVHKIKSMRQRKLVGLMKGSIPLSRPYYHVDDLSLIDNEIERKYSFLTKPIGKPWDDETATIDISSYDTMIIGCGTAALYAAALLSRAGRKVLFLCREEDASGCVEIPQYSGIPFDIESHNITKISKQQQLLAPALCSDSDCQGGVRFAQIGSEVDGYAFEILSIPGVGTDKADAEIPFVLRASGGLASFMEDAATLTGDGWPSSDGSVGDSSSGGFVQALEKINAVAGEFYLTRLIPENSRLKVPSAKPYQKASSQHAQAYLNAAFPLNTSLRSLLAGMGLKGENLRPSKASMAPHITNICGAMSGEGMHYPIGGPRALGHALASVVEAAGGQIVTKVAIDELLFDEDKRSTGTAPGTSESTGSQHLKPPTCVGVKLVSGKEVRFSPSRFVSSAKDPVVISFLPFIETFIRMLPDAVRDKYGVPRGLPALSEQRPVLYFLYILDGTADDLDVTGADYYRLPGAARAVDVIDASTHEVTQGEIGWIDADERDTNTENGPADASNATEQATSHDRKRRKPKQKKYEVGVSWIHISFPSAKDPSFLARYRDISTCVVAIEADDEVVTDMATAPRIFSCKKITSGVIESMNRLESQVRIDLMNIFPQLKGMYRLCS